MKTKQIFLPKKRSFNIFFIERIPSINKISYKVINKAYIVFLLIIALINNRKLLN